MEYVSAASVPQPRAEAAAPSARGGGRRSLAAALLAGAVGAAVVLLASGQTWARGNAAVGGGALALKVSGGAVTGVPSALAIVGLAALVAVFAVRGAGRILVSALLTLSGAGAAATAWLGVGDSAALNEKAATASGDAAATADAITHTGWPYVAVVGGALLLLAGLLALRFGAAWPAMGGRYERDGTPRPRKARTVPDPERPEEIWKALDRGEDPTRAS
ncbi:TIGR02234 family membrane protein [Streptomyces xanthochromogenes]|uniref:TIGR02234 family membrane protein n=1 Tax=Streptomyces xanthochromogenes TaxID=67384 RepID=UPI0037A43C99